VGGVFIAGATLDLGDLRRDLIECGGHQLVHRLRVLALDEARRVPVALEQRAQLGGRNAREHRWARDLVAVEMQDGEHRAIVDGIEELVGVPARRERTCLGLAVAYHAADEQVGVIERRAVGMRQGVAELAALVDRPRRLRRHVARDATREGELAKQPAQALHVAADVRVDLAVGALQVHVRNDPGATVTRADHVDRVQVTLADHAVHVRVEEVQARSRAPMAEQMWLYVLDRKRLAQQRILEQVYLADRQVVRRPPVSIQRAQLPTRQDSRWVCHGRVVDHDGEGDGSAWRPGTPAAA
jgi:hypothetical protein